MYLLSVFYARFQFAFNKQSVRQIVRKGDKSGIKINLFCINYSKFKNHNCSLVFLLPKVLFSLFLIQYFSEKTPKISFSKVKNNKLVYKRDPKSPSLSLVRSSYQHIDIQKQNFTPTAANYVTPTVFSMKLYYFIKLIKQILCHC